MLPEIPAVLLKDKLSPKPQLSRQSGKFLLRWADLSATGYGVSLLNDCKYGYDSQPPACASLPAGVPVGLIQWQIGASTIHLRPLSSLRQLAISPHS